MKNGQGAHLTDRLPEPPHVPQEPLVPDEGSRGHRAAHPEHRGAWLLSVFAGLYLASISLFSYSKELNAFEAPQAIMAVLGFAVIAKLLVLRQRPIMPAAITFFLLWVLLSGMTLLAIGINPLEQVAYLTVVKVAISTALVANIPERLSDLRRMLMTFVIAFPVVLFLNMEELQGALLSMGEGTLDQGERFAGTLANANTAAWFGMLAGWAALTLLLISRSKFRIFYVAIIAASVVLILISGSRKGLLAIPISVFILYAVYYIKHPKRRFVMGMLFPLALIVAYVLFLAVVSSPFGGRIEAVLSGEGESSADVRLDMAEAGIPLLLESPAFGIGFDQFRVQSWRYGGAVGSYSHSTVVEVLSCTGLVGMGLYCTSLFFFFRRFVKARKRSRGDSALTFMGLSLGLLFFFCFFSIFAVMYDDKLSWPILGAIVGYSSRVVAASTAAGVRATAVRKSLTPSTRQRFLAFGERPTPHDMKPKSRSKPSRDPGPSRT